MNGFKRILPILILALPTILLSVYIILKIFKPGYIIYIDVTEGITVAELPLRYLYTYSNDIGESLAEKARIPLFYFIYAIFKFTALDDSYYVKVKILLLIVSSFLAFSALTYKLLQLIVSEQKEETTAQPSKSWLMFGSVMGGLIYVLNYWFTNRIAHFYLFFTSITIPLTFYYGYKYFFTADKSFKDLIKLALLLSIFSATPHSLMFEFFIMLVLFVISVILRKGVLNKLAHFVGFWTLYLLTNIYWILPFLKSGSKPDAVLSENIVSLLAKGTEFKNTISLTAYWLTEYKDYFTQNNLVLGNVQIVSSFFPFLLLLLAILVYKKSPISKVLMIFLILSVIAGSFNYLGNLVYFYLMFDSPIKELGWLFREYDKFGIIISYLYAVALGLLIVSFYKNTKVLGSILLVTIVTLGSYFYFFNKVFTNYYQPQPIPKDFYEVNKILKQDQEDFNVAWYPGVPEATWAKTPEVRYVFTNLISAKPSITTRSEMVNYLSFLMKDANAYTINMGKALDLTGVKYLIIRKDDNYLGINETLDGLDRQDSLEKVLETQLLTVYRNKVYSGLIKSYTSRLLTTEGLETLTKLDTLNIDTSKTFIDYSDKPFGDTNIPTQIYAPSNSYIDIAMGQFKNKFIYPYNYSTTKDYGDSSFWDKGSLENLNHAEVDFYFNNFDLDITQFDFNSGIVTARDTYQKVDSFKKALQNYELKFSIVPNVKLEGKKILYEPKPEDFTGYWNIVESDKIQVEPDTKAIELKLESNIPADLIPHFKVFSYDENYEFLDVKSLYPDERNRVGSIVKLPDTTRYINFTIWTTVDPQNRPSFQLNNVTISNISDNIQPLKLNINTVTNCQDKCHVYTRFLKSHVGGEIELKIGSESLKLTTHDELSDRYYWQKIGEINNTPKTTDIELINTRGFNSLNALVFLTEQENNKLNAEIQVLNNTQQSPLDPNILKAKLDTKKINPTQYDIQALSSGTQIIALPKPYTKGWALETANQNLESRHINGVINGWEVKDTKSFDKLAIKHTPQTYFNIGSAISITTILVLNIYLFFGGVGSKKRN